MRLRKAPRVPFPFLGKESKWKTMEKSNWKEQLITQGADVEVVCRQ